MSADNFCVKICDALMGSGKTQAAIRYMNEGAGTGRYMYITPYLAETERIAEACPDKNFALPEDKGEGKFADLDDLLNAGRNIASTHALFENITHEIIELIGTKGYTLIIDEVLDPIHPLAIKKTDVDFIKGEGILRTRNERGLMACDGKRLQSFSNYGVFQTLKRLCDCDNLYSSGDAFMFSIFPEQAFRAFDDVTILTYMFEGQSLCYYFKFTGVPYRYIGVEEFDDNGERGFRFTDEPVKQYYPWLKEKIHISIYTHQNKIGTPLSALSSSWYYRRNHADNKDMDILRRNLVNTFRQIFKCTSKEAMWTCFKRYQRLIKKTGYASSFVSSNSRSTNKYRDRRYLAYLCNVYRNPYVAKFFQSRGISVEENSFAISEMVQWIFRSAIRDKQDIWIYVPSRRMRVLLRKWIDDNAVRHIPVEQRTYRPRETKAEKNKRLREETLAQMPDFGDDEKARDFWIETHISKMHVNKVRKDRKQIAVAMDYYKKKEQDEPK